MLLLMEQIADKALRDTLRKAWIDPGLQCRTDILGDDGLPYRHEEKPKGNKAMLVKYGFFVDTIGGKLFARIPLGVHGADHMGIDPETGRIGCVLCDGEK